MAYAHLGDSASLEAAEKAKAISAAKVAGK
jgi:hypothetical protein